MRGAEPRLDIGEEGALNDAPSSEGDAGGGGTGAGGTGEASDGATEAGEPAETIVEDIDAGDCGAPKLGARACIAGASGTGVGAMP